MSHANKSFQYNAEMTKASFSYNKHMYVIVSSAEDLFIFKTNKANQTVLATVSIESLCENDDPVGIINTIIHDDEHWQDTEGVTEDDVECVKLDDYTQYALSVIIS